jgi:hypothetical protein
MFLFVKLLLLNSKVNNTAVKYTTINRSKYIYHLWAINFIVDGDLHRKCQRVNKHLELENELKQM